MRLTKLAISICTCLIALETPAAERAFQIFSTKQITSQVDRFYGKDNNAFATVFCKDDHAEVMMVDSRLPDLDGKVFLFSSYEACEQARTSARELHKKCVVGLVIDQATLAARLDTSTCR